MPRQKNIRPTTIYWLVDIRSETIGAGWSNGKPFYCGKTVQPVHIRLRKHRNSPHGNVGIHVLKYGEFIRIETMEVVPLEKDWGSREKFWISQVRLMNPDCANVADGGAGAPGNIVPPEVRAKISAAMRGRKKPPEHAAKVGAAHKGRKLSPEHREKLRAAKIGRKLSDEHRANLSRAHRVYRGEVVNSPDARQKLSNALRGTKRSPATREKVRLASLGRKLSPESIAKRTATQAHNRKQRMSVPL